MANLKFANSSGSFIQDPTPFTALNRMHKKAVRQCCFSPDTNQILTASEDETVVLWNIPDADVELHDETINDEHKLVCYRLSDHKMPVMSVAINQNYFVSASKDGIVKLWKLEHDLSYRNTFFKCPNPTPSTYKCHTKIVRSVSISNNEKYFATGSDDKSIKVWSAECRNKLVLSLLDGHTNWIKCIKWSKLNDSILASCGDDSKICLWDTRTKVRQPPYYIIKTRKSTQFNSLDWHPIFEHHIVTGAQDSSCFVWDLRNKKHVQAYAEHLGAVNSVSFSNAGSLLLTGSSDMTCKIFDVCEGRSMFTLKSHNGPLTSVCFNGSDEMIATASQDKMTTVWKKNFEAVSIELTSDDEENVNETKLNL